MVACEKCKGELKFFERQSVTSLDIDKAFPEYKDAKLCNDCRQQLQHIASKKLKDQLLEVPNVQELDTSLVSAQSKLKHFEVVGYILYQSNNKTNFPLGVTSAIRKIQVYANIKSFVVPWCLNELAKKKFAFQIDPVRLEYKLTPIGEKWIEDTVLPKLKGVAVLSEDIKKAILWQKDEIPLGQIECKEFFEDKAVSLSARVGHNGFLVVTTQRVFFACKLGMLAREYAVIYGANLENLVTVSHGRFGFNDKLVILDSNNQHRDFVHPNIQSLIPTINTAITDRKNQLLAEKQKERIQIVLDFSSLKDVMAKGGLVMTTYKCPNCNGMVNIPAAGKVLMCQYCGTLIKPVDIFEKIKSLIQ